MSKGGSSTSTSKVEIPEYIEKAAQQNLNQAQAVSQLGYVPYFGPTVAAFTPMQQAAMQNTAGAASAFGMATPTGNDVYGGMEAPTQYAGGVQGYSSAPLYQQSLQQLQQQRPGQYDYINSFFIDPFTGLAGSNVTPTVDYTQYATATDMANAQMANDLAIAQAQSGPQSVVNVGGTTVGPTNLNLTQNELDQYENIIAPSTSVNSAYNAQTDILTPEQQLYVNQYQAPALDMNMETNEYANDPNVAADAVNMAITGDANNSFTDDLNMLFGNEPTFDDPSSAGSYGGSLVTGELSGDFTPLPGIVGTIADTLVTELAPEYAMNQQTEQLAEAAGSTQNADGSYDISSWFSDTSDSPTINTSTFQTDYSSNNNSGSGSGSSGSSTSGSVTINAGDTLSAIAAANNTTVDALAAANNISDPNMIYAGDSLVIPTAAAPQSDDIAGTMQSAPQSDDISNSGSDDGGSSGGGGGGGCVVATHAVSAGAFTPSMKREAVVWCMHNLHDKWWGEAIRRGYRHLGRKKIEQGKAHEHYQEFRNYIDFASGKKRTIKSAIHFAARTVQFFAVGLVKGDA